MALVGLNRKRWRVGESVGASLVASAGLTPVRRGRRRRGLLREAPAGLRREQTNVGRNCGHDSRNCLCCPTTHKPHGGVAVALVTRRLHILEREGQDPFEDQPREPAETCFHDKCYEVWSECGSDFFGRTTDLGKAKRKAAAIRKTGIPGSRPCLSIVSYLPRAWAVKVS